MWTSAFKDALKSGHYHPKFRLVIGTYGVHHPSAGFFEEANWPWVIEITSHGDPARDYDEFASYKHVQGLTEGISFGAQSVAPRTWEYQMASLSVEVTHEAATIALAATVGCLAKLECDMNGSGYNTIFMGQYLGMSWSMGKGTTTLQFRDGLSYLQSMSTERASYTDEYGRNHWYSWFKGIGEVGEKTTNTVCTPGTSASVSFSAGFTGTTTDLEKNGFAFNYRHDDAFTIYNADKMGFTEANGNRFAYCSEPTSGNRFLFRYRYAQSSSIASLLVEPLNNAVFGFETPTDSTFGTSSKVRPALAIYGNPVCELANTFYVNGYHKHMVGSLFSIPYRSHAMLDFDSMTAYAGVYRSIWESAAGTAVGAPLRTVLHTEQRDGFATLRPLFAKMGVFPRFKNGAYSVGMGLDPSRLYAHGIQAGVIRYNEIVSMTWDQVDSSNRQIYNEVKFTNTDTVSHSVSAGAGATPKSGPIINALTVNSSDVAAGEAAAQRFADWYIEEQFLPWYAYHPPMRSTITLNNLRWAKAGLGETVKVEYPATTINKRGWRHRLIGPSEYRYPNFNPAAADGHTNWLIVSTHTDWIRGQVTLELVANRQPSVNPDSM